jgi:hypothetical protein
MTKPLFSRQINPTQRPRGSVRMSVTLPEHVARKISEVSFAQGRSMSGLISYLLERAMESITPEV